MPYTKEEGGRLNNFAVEPAVYSAKAATPQEKRNFILLAALAVALVGGLIAVAVFASQVG
jgi:hypothetical protein